MLRSMETAPLDRPIIVKATRMVVGLGPIDEPPFDTQARFYPEQGFWAAEDRPPHGLPSLGLVPLNTLGWIY
jgi:hypothetical protein